jgi:hypothetical protein
MGNYSENKLYKVYSSTPGQYMAGAILKALVEEMGCEDYEKSNLLLALTQLSYSYISSIPSRRGALG